MRFLRSIICVFVLFVFALFAFFLNTFVLPIAKMFFNETEYKYFASDVIHFLWGKVLLNLLKYSGLTNYNIKNYVELKSIKNKVIVATHPSFIDIVILIGLIPRTTCFVKQELTKNPLLSNIIKSIFISNDVEIEELKKESKTMLDLGFNVVIFPSGTRHRNEEHPKLKKGASLIAINSHKNIVPVKMYSDGEFMFIHKPIYDVDKKRVEFYVEKLEEIDVTPFLEMDDIESKKTLTKEITNSLYN